MEVTSRTLQGRFLLKPSPEANRRILGVLGRGLRRHPRIKLHAYVFLSNHYHLLASTPDAQELGAFVGYLNSNLARELGRLYRWRERFWGRRYRAILVSEEEPAQLDRLDYQLGQACKEGLVASPRHWPGVTWVRAVLSDRPDVGIWRRRVDESEALRQGRTPAPGEFLDEETVRLSQLPCWRHLDGREYRARVGKRVAQIEKTTRELHRQRGSRPLGRRAVLCQRPHHHAESLHKTPAPRFHCASRVAREVLWAAYRLFVEAYRRAVLALKRGKRDASFPAGSFLPPLPLRAPT